MEWLESRGVARWMGAAIALLFLIRIVLATRLLLIPDEAYYWAWGREPAWCHYDHPGMIGWVEWLFTQVSGLSNRFTARLPILLMAAGVTWLVFRISLDLFGRPGRAWLAALLFNLAPAFYLGGFLVLPDAPLVFFALLSAWLLVRAWKSHCNALLYAVGAALSATVMSKFSGVFIGAGVALFFVTCRERARWLRNPHLYAAGALAIALFAPVLRWNQEHGWVAYHAVNRLTSRHPDSLANVAKYAFCFHGNQLLIISPLLLVAVLVGLRYGVREWWRGRDDRALLCLALSLPVLLYFSYASFRTWAEANWPVFAYPLALVWAVEAAGRASAGRWLGARRFWLWTAGVAAALNLFVSTHAVFNLIPGAFPRLLKQDRMLREFYGWDELGAEVARRRCGEVLMALRYQTCSLIQFHAPTQPCVTCMNAFGRGNHFDFVNDYAALEGHNVLIIAEGHIPEDLAGKFERLEGPVTFEIPFRGVVVKRFLFYRGIAWSNTRGRDLTKRREI